MLTTLIESKSRREQSAAQMLGSVAAHTAIIGAALYATAGAGPRTIPTARSIEIPMVYHPAADRSNDAHPTPRTTSVNSPGRSWKTIAATIQVEIPRMEGPALILDPGTLAGTALADLSRGNGLREPGFVYSGEAMRADQVEKQAALAPGNAPPRYPEALIASGIEGQVVATFVISAEGRYEEGSLRFVRSDNALFERAVETALLRMRFVPAEIAGRNVRQLVQMPFVFTLQR
jgi:protein TonB